MNFLKEIAKGLLSFQRALIPTKGSYPSKRLFSLQRALFPPKGSYPSNDE